VYTYIYISSIYLCISLQVTLQEIDDEKGQARGQLSALAEQSESLQDELAQQRGRLEHVSGQVQF